MKARVALIFLTACVAVCGASNFGSIAAGRQRSSAGSTPVDTSYTFSSTGDTNGIMYALGTNFGAVSWTNPYTAARIAITDSSSNTTLDANQVDRAWSGAASTANVVNSWVEFDFGAAVVKPNHYSIQDRQTGSTNHNIVTWVIEGSNDNSTWTTLHTGTSTPSGWSSGTIADFSISTSTFYRYIRWTQTGVNSDGAYYFCPGEFEIYGTYRTFI